MKIYIICPVTNATQEQQETIDLHATRLRKQGHDVHNPKYAVDQKSSGHAICMKHFVAMRDCNEVHVFWDSSSQGSCFDLGMAFVLDKNINLIEIIGEECTEGKLQSLQSVLEDMVTI